MSMIIGRGRTLFIDIDSTLIRPATAGDYEGQVAIGGYLFVRLEHNIDTLRRFAANDDTTIIAWSNGGAGWAHQVALAIGIEHLVSVCLSKPTFYLDDRADAGFAGDPEKWIDATKAS